MISSGPHPHASRRCLSGRAYSTCAHTLSGTLAALLATPDHLSESRFSLLPTKLPSPAHPRGGIPRPTFVFLQHRTTPLKTEQYPLKIDLRAKV